MGVQLHPQHPLFRRPWPMCFCTYHTELLVFSINDDEDEDEDDDDGDDDDDDEIRKLLFEL